MKFKSLNLILVNSKRKFAAIAVISALCLTWAACQKSNSGNVAPAKIDQKQYDNIGILHNHDVDSMYNVLLSMKNNHQLNLSKSDLVSFVKNGILNNLKNQGTNPKVISAINSTLDGQFLTIRTNISKRVNSTSTLQPSALYSDSLATRLTVNQKQVLDKLLFVMTDESATFEETQNQIIALEASAKSDLSEDELPVILVSTSVAKNTIVYWHDNIDKWVALLKNGSNVSTQGLKTNLADPGFSWRNVGAADVAGAATGAVATWWLNIAAGPGQLAYGAAIGSGAAGASVGNAVYQLLSN